MQAKLQHDKKILLLVDPEVDADLYAQMMERYAKKKWVEADHPRVEKPPEHAGEFANKDDGPKVKIDPKAVEAKPYHSMTSYPTFADTTEKRKILDAHPEILKKWRELATARVSMGTAERQRHNKILDPAFRALKAAYEAAAPKWNALKEPEVEIPKRAKKKMAAVKVKVKANDIDKVKETAKKKAKDSKTLSSMILAAMRKIKPEKQSRPVGILNRPIVYPTEKEVEDGLRVVLSRMSADCLSRCVSVIKSVKFIQEGERHGGQFDPADGELQISYSGLGLIGVQELIAHEFGHAVDYAYSDEGLGMLVSDSDEWQAAYDDEIADGQLSDYAMRQPKWRPRQQGSDYEEGFAEFARLMWQNQDKNRRPQRELIGGSNSYDIENDFPKCLAVWKKWGLS